jgi:DNA-binding XRE family transcriptional regulator
MKQKDVGKQLGVSTDCVTYWENNRSKPMIHQVPRIVEFLGYNPLSIDQTSLAGRVKNYCIQNGLSHKKLGKILGVNASAIGAWEKNHPISRKNYDRLIKLFVTDTPSWENKK